MHSGEARALQRGICYDINNTPFPVDSAAWNSGSMKNFHASTNELSSIFVRSKHRFNQSRVLLNFTRNNQVFLS
ncbi:hypothetical protein Hanom_Chr13g01225561 [Helianthus anomalus]